MEMCAKWRDFVMRYVISDIHGCCKEFEALLECIHFSGKDTLYVLGDVIDRGPDPVGVLRLMSLHENIIPILGNHEYMMLKVLPGLLEEIREDTIEKVLTADRMYAWQLWTGDGGKVTMEAFRKLTSDDREFYLEYVEDFSLYEEVTVGKQDFLLIHSLPENFHQTHCLDYSVEEIIFARPAFSAEWDQDARYIIGHTPTCYLRTEYQGKIFRKGNLIDIDCGCVSGYTLCAYCLDTGEAFYVPAFDRY